MNKQELKEAIRAFEYYFGGYGMLANIGINVTNIRKNKDTVKADVRIVRYNEGEEFYRDCVYSLKELSKINESLKKAEV